jgi:glutaredoxin
MFCQRVKEFFHEHGVAYRDRDITKDEAAIAELEQLGLMTTPVTVVDGETIVGYNLPRLTAVLGL